MGLQVLTVDANKEDINILVPYLRHESLLVARKAADAIASVASPRYSKHAKVLLHYITTKSDNEFRLSLLRALGRIGDTSLVRDILLNSLHLRPNERRQIEKIIFKMGLKTVPSLLSITKDTDLHDRSRLLAGKILRRLALPQLKANLPSIIKLEIERANFYFFQHHTIQDAYPDKDLRVLKDALLSGYHSVIDFIIQTLGMAGEIEDSELLSRSMRSSNPKIRSQVIETLERTCDTTLFRLLQPLVDELPLSVKLKSSTMNPLSLNELLAILRTSPSLTDQVAAAAISSSENLPDWRATLKRQMKNNEEIFNHFAYELLET
jgi:HEAT repeat protein